MDLGRLYISCAQLSDNMLFNMSFNMLFNKLRQSKRAN
jgi:hypothetical protein